MTRRVVLVLLVVAGCASEPRPEPRLEASPTRQEREDARRKEEARKREEARAEIERQKAEQARNEEEWPEGRPVIFVRGEPAPVKTRTAIMAPDHPPAEPAAESRPMADPAPVRFAPRPEPKDASLRADADAFVRRLDLLDRSAVSADAGFRNEARRRAEGWTHSRVSLVQRDPERARREGIYEPTEREIQAVNDQALMESRARWIRDERVRETVNTKMKGVK